MLILVGKMPHVNMVFVFEVLIGGEICCKCKRNPRQVTLKGPCSPISTLSYFWLPFENVLVLSLKPRESANIEFAFKKSVYKGLLQTWSSWHWRAVAGDWPPHAFTHSLIHTASVHHVLKGTCFAPSKLCLGGSFLQEIHVATSRTTHIGTGITATFPR